MPVTVKGTARVTPMEDEFRKPGPGPLGGMWTLRGGYDYARLC